MAKKETCRVCGCKFNHEEAAKEFESYFDYTPDVYYDAGFAGICGECAIDIESQSSTTYDEKNPPPGCRACGGNYPYCADSCPLFD